MEITQTVIPHSFRNKYLRAGSATINNNGGSVYSSTSTGTTGGGGSSDYAQVAEAAKHLLNIVNVYGNPWSGTTDLYAISATTIEADQVSTDVLEALEAVIASLSGDSASIDDLSATTINSVNITNSDTIKTHNLDVTGQAHFFELIIDKIKAAGGAVMFTPADGFRVDKVVETENGFKLYWRSTNENGKGIKNMWKVNDQACCRSFNEATVGTSYNVSNKYYWSLVTDTIETPISVDFSGETHDCYYIEISKTTKDGNVNPEVDDEIVMIGYRGTDDTNRQSAIYMSAYQSLDKGLTAPLFAVYQGINDFDLESHRKTFIDASRAEFIGSFKVSDGTTIEDYISGCVETKASQFTYDINGLKSRVSKVSRPNIIASNGWTDQQDRELYQEDDELYQISASTTETRGINDLEAYPPAMYLNKGTYTMSAYAKAKYLPISYGTTKDNLDKTLNVSTAINSGDTWVGESRSIMTFMAPIDGYYQIGARLMDDSWQGDYEYVEYTEPVTPITPGGETPSGITPTTITISITAM